MSSRRCAENASTEGMGPDGFVPSGPTYLSHPSSLFILDCLVRGGSASRKQRHARDQSSDGFLNAI